MQCLLIVAAVTGYHEALTQNLQGQHLHDPTVEQAEEEKLPTTMMVNEGL